LGSVSETLLINHLNSRKSFFTTQKLRKVCTRMDSNSFWYVHFRSNKAIYGFNDVNIQALNFFTSSVNTLCNKTMEDTIFTVKQYEAARYFISNINIFKTLTSVPSRRRERDMGIKKWRKRGAA